MEGDTMRLHFTAICVMIGFVFGLDMSATNGEPAGKRVRDAHGRSAASKDAGGVWKQSTGGIAGGAGEPCASNEDCNDGNDCTLDVCNAEQFCEYPNAEEGAPCGNPDDSVCNHADTCDDLGVCQDNIQPDGTPCPNENPCTLDECMIGLCIRTTIPDCVTCSTNDDCFDDDECTMDVCSNPGGCENPRAEPGTPCGDPSNTDCDNPDTCDDTGACMDNLESDGTSCSDELFCNGEETCFEGECSSGAEPCTDQDHCDEEGNACLACIDNAECDDGNECTEDVCVEWECSHVWIPECGALAQLDIKPGSCPNPLNTGSRGVLPAAIVGSDELDVAEIDIDSITLSRADGVGGEVQPLSGRKGPRTVIDDVASSFDGEFCDCHALMGDGIDDLILKFSTVELADVLELDSIERGTLMTLTVSGTFLDGGAFSASDCILVKRAKGYDEE